MVSFFCATDKIFHSLRFYKLPILYHLTNINGVGRCAFHLKTPLLVTKRRHDNIKEQGLPAGKNLFSETYPKDT